MDSTQHAVRVHSTRVQPDVTIRGFYNFTVEWHQNARIHALMYNQTYHKSRWTHILPHQGNEAHLPHSTIKLMLIWAINIITQLLNYNLYNFLDSPKVLYMHHVNVKILLLLIWSLSSCRYSVPTVIFFFGCFFFFLPNFSWFTYL